MASSSKGAASWRVTARIRSSAEASIAPPAAGSVSLTRASLHGLEERPNAGQPGVDVAQRHRADREAHPSGLFLQPERLERDDREPSFLEQQPPDLFVRADRPAVPALSDQIEPRREVDGSLRREAFHRKPL